MAAATGMSQSAVSRIWRAFGLKPHQSEAFKLSPDPQFIDKVRDIVGLYLNPPEAAVVLCVDEKSQIQALDRSAPILPLMPGCRQRQSHDYIRNGTTNLYAALDVASGQVLAEMTPRHRAEEFRRFLNLIDASVPAHLDVHVVLDNSSTHKTPSIQRWLVRHPRFTLHFTPTYSSWLNLVERWFAELTTKWIKRGSPPLCPRPRRLDPHLDHQLERRPQTVRLAQDRRRDPRQPRHLLPTDQRLRSLAGRRYDDRPASRQYAGSSSTSFCATSAASKPAWPLRVGLDVVLARLVVLPVDVALGRCHLGLLVGAFESAVVARLSWVQRLKKRFESHAAQYRGAGSPGGSSRHARGGNPQFAGEMGEKPPDETVAPTCEPPRSCG